MATTGRLQYNEAHFAAKPKTRDYYAYGVELLLGADLGSLKLDEITSKNAAGFIAKRSDLSPSTINCGLRTLRRALNLAVEWGKLGRPPKVRLAQGERQRERVVTDAEFAAYIELCQQPWRDVALLIRYEAMRPSECYCLRWEHVLLNEEEQSGLIQIADGKSKAARRFLPVALEVFTALWGRWDTAGRPAEGWVFPSASKSGHLEENSAKNVHCRLLARLCKATAAHKNWPNQEEPSASWTEFVASSAGLEKHFVSRHHEIIRAGLQPFEPYCLRHTALTKFGEHCDVFTLAKIAGHSSITITQSYVHPQQDAIERAFERLKAQSRGTLNERKDVKNLKS